MFKYLKNSLMIVLAVVFFGLTANSNKAFAASHLAGGDFAQAFNNTTQQGTWTDPVSAAPGDVIEFRVTAKNDGDQPTGDVQVWGSVTGQVPQDPAMSLVMTSKVNDPNMSNSLQDTVTVNITGSTPVGMRYYPGHARLNGVTSLYNCPNTCDIPDNGVLGGFDVGVIQPGQFVEVAFKASLSAVASPSPSASVTTQTNNCANGTVSGSNVNCSNNIGGNTSVTQNITNNPAPAQPKVVAVAATPVHELPKTGAPLAAFALSGLLPAGFGLKRFGKNKDQVTPLSILEEKIEKRLA